jgi:hypothetical protein
MLDLEEALRRSVTKITVEIMEGGFRWSLFDGVQCTFTTKAESDQIAAMLTATGVIMQIQLGIVPQFLRDEIRHHRDAQRPSLN